MQRDEFLAQLTALAMEAKKSSDETVRLSAVVLFGLTGSIHAGDGFFQPFVDNVATVIKNQHEILIRMSAAK